jgi:hypothetical protein
MINPLWFDLVGGAIGTWVLTAIVGVKEVRAARSKP